MLRVSVPGNGILKVDSHGAWRVLEKRLVCIAWVQLTRLIGIARRVGSRQSSVFMSRAKEKLILVCYFFDFTNTF